MQSSTTSSLSSSSLQCTTKYICLTADGSCDEMVEPEETVEVESKEEIYQELSEQKAQCWWMFGQGEIDYVGDDATQNNYCSICHQTHFDDSLKSVEGVDNSIDKDELYNYMTENNYSDSQTYAQFILGSNDIESLKRQIVEGEGVEANEVSFGEIETGETHYNVMGITSDIGETYYWIGGSIAAVGIITYPVTGPFWTGAVLVSGIGSGFYGDDVSRALTDPEIASINLKGRGIDNQFMAPTFQKANSDKFKALNCEVVVTDSS